MTRREYSKPTKRQQIREALNKATPEQLQNINYCKELVNKAGIKTGPQEIYAVRKQLLSNLDTVVEQGTGTTIKRIDVVVKAAKAIGGLDQLKQTIQIIEKVKAIQ